MREMILLKQGEIVLKGMNRRAFEQKLEENIKKALAGLPPYRLRSCQSTVYIEPEDGTDCSLYIERLKKVFGIVNIVRAGAAPKDMDALLEFAPVYLKNTLMAAKTFKVETKRADKKFPYNSPQISAMLGGKLLESFHHLRVDVENPDVVVRAEIREKESFVHAGRMQGAGGMPVGTNSKALLLLSGGIDSPVAGHMTARRGVEIEAIHFFSYPYTSEAAKEKVLSLAKILSDYTGPIKVHLIPFTKQQLQIRDNCPEEHFTLIMRRIMMKIASEVAKRNHCHALVTGESIGQVASQTMWALGVTDPAADIPVFRPVIGMDKEEIITRAREIGTFDTSVLPYEDCCTVFTPKHPTTRPKLVNILHSEEKLDVDTMVREAIDGMDTVVLGK